MLIMGQRSLQYINDINPDDEENEGTNEDGLAVAP